MDISEHREWWFVESDSGGIWCRVGCNFVNLADAGDFADRLRDRHPATKYRVVRIETIRAIEDA